MDSSSGFPLNIVITPDQNSFNFENLEELESFVAKERSIWSWVRSAEATRGRNLSVASWVENNFYEISVAIDRMKQGIPTQSSGIDAVFQTVFGDRKFPYPNSPLQKYIETLSKSDAEAAYLSLEFLASNAQYANQSIEKSRAAHGVLSLMLGQNSKTPSAIKNSMVELEKELRRKNEDSNRLAIDQKLDFDRQKNRFDALETTASKRLAKSAQRLGQQTIRNNTAKISDLQSLVSKAVAELELTRQTYAEFMTLSAPVQYWKDKSERHKSNSVRLSCTLIGMAIFGGALLLGFLNSISNDILTSKYPEAFGSHAVQISQGIVATTIIFWIARILTRLFLSQNHLAIDAEERATMVETYLALINNGSAEKEDRHIVLDSLFRPTADGIVKDDAAPDLSPASLLARIGTAK
ncbi:MAG: DUF6161 domain-containing protein [Rhizobiaceae bacterium]